MPSTAVIQVKQGIGDAVWHLPFVRAIAGATAEGAVTFGVQQGEEFVPRLFAELAVPIKGVSVFENKTWTITTANLLQCEGYR